MNSCGTYTYSYEDDRDEEVEVKLTYTASPGSKATRYDPPEPSELEIVGPEHFEARLVKDYEDIAEEIWQHIADADEAARDEADEARYETRRENRCT